MGLTPEEYGFTSEKFREGDFPCSTLKTMIVLKIKGSTPPKIPYFFFKLTPKEILNFYNLSQKNFIGPQPVKKEGGY